MGERLEDASSLVEVDEEDDDDDAIAIPQLNIRGCLMISFLCMEILIRAGPFGDALVNKARVSTLPAPLDFVLMHNLL